MEQYISKSVLVAEINKFIERAEAERVLYPKTILAGKNYLLIEDYKKLLSKIDTLEVKEVDLEKEIKEEYLKSRCYGGRDNMFVILNEPQFNKIAKHFFELGLSVSNKAQKGEEV